MKKLKYIPSLILFCLCVGVCVVGVYSLSSINANIKGNIIITAGSTDVKVDYGIEISNAAKSSEFTLEEPERIYINSSNSASGSLIELSEDNQNVGLGNLFFSSHSEGIEDIQISITLKNNSLYPVLVNFALGDSNTVGVYSDNTLKEIYLSSNSQALGNSAVIAKTYGLSVFDFYLKLNEPTSDLSQTNLFNLNISFNKAAEEDVVVTLPITYAEVVQEDVKTYIQIAETKVITEVVSNRAEGMKCKPFKFEFTLPLGVNKAMVKIAHNSNFTNATTYNLTTNSVTLENLFVNTNYYYKLTYLSGSVQVGYKLGIISTTKTPRLLSVDGAFNTRDIGGWQTSANIKQGLLIRGTEIDGAVEAKYCATEEGLETLKGFGIVVDFDLRNNTNDTPISDATKLSFASPSYQYVFSSTYSEVMKNMFTELARPENYPMYLHCTYGCDRTGTICYLLEALLGVSDLELMIDYELSGLFSTGTTRNSTSFVAFLDALAGIDGDTTQEKVTTYLLSIGITEEQIQSIKDIFLEG